jgi:pimeloyl-ACP methyl ester carboxylesterase
MQNPPLIMLHGGPGLGETGFFRHYNAPLEKDFTVVYWDQRGAGRSADPSIPRTSMTLDQFLSDLNELVDRVCERLQKTKVVLFGHSWGSVLGVVYAARYPQKVAAYVGSGQVGDWAAAETASYAFALAEAQRRGKRKAERELLAIGEPPYSATKVFKERTWVSRLEGKMRPRALIELVRALLSVKETSILEMPAAWRSFKATLDAMWEDVSKIDLNQLVPALDMPVFFFLGAKDHWVPPETSVAYFETLSAPADLAPPFPTTSIDQRGARPHG